MTLAELVDLDRFTTSLHPPSKCLFDRWQHTAFEVAPDRTNEIARTFQIWNEIPQRELRVDQLTSYIEELLRILQTEERQKTFLTIEALQFRRFQ